MRFLIILTMMLTMLASCGGEEKPLECHTTEYVIEVTFNNGDKEKITHDMENCGNDDIKITLDTNDGVTCLEIQYRGKDNYRRWVNLACGVRKFQII